MSIVQEVDKVKDIIPNYWPIGSFIHHNPLKGFESMLFKDALGKAQDIFGGKVYMDSLYYLELYKKGKIKDFFLRKNIKNITKKESKEKVEFVLKCMLEIAPYWSSLKLDATKKGSVGVEVDERLLNFLTQEYNYDDKQRWLKELMKNMTLYEINDILFGYDDKEFIEKSIIEFVSRFLDEEQTTISMPNRELGMFESFKRYANLDFKHDAKVFVEQKISALKVSDIRDYLLTHILKHHGWAGFIKYRSQNVDYYAQQTHPASLVEYLAVRLYYESEYAKKAKIKDFKQLKAYIESNPSYAILKFLKHKGTLFGKYIDAMEIGKDYDSILRSYIDEMLKVEARQIALAKKRLKDEHIDSVELAKTLKWLHKEEGYIWLKSLEDSYIEEFLNDYVKGEGVDTKQALASATFCLDVRSEVIRRSFESLGSYKTFGAGGFLGMPIAFVEFDKAHEQFLCPAIIKPNNVIFELPIEPHEAYSKKKGVSKTTKKILSDLKNNPYTPYIMVEAIGWLFGINLFGKTFSPRKTNKLFSRLKPKKPKTTYTIDKLTEDEIEYYVNKFHTTFIKSFLEEKMRKTFTKEQVQIVRDYLVFGKELKGVKVEEKYIKILKSDYKIGKDDYVFQKKRLTCVGFTLEEKTRYLYNFLMMTGQTEDFPEFVILVGHGSISDNNPFESALDCGACGGSISLPNNRTLCMIANREDVREELSKLGINIPKKTIFIPALHTTSTDRVEFFDLEAIKGDALKRLKKVQEDFKEASRLARLERLKELPHTNSEEDIFVKSIDWSEPRPEWGLAKNIGVYAGSRKYTKHMKLKNRYFMHSYSSKIDDENATFLTKIFDGPLVVGEWINLEHYFSTVDNSHFGAGSKVYHNVVAKVGVFYGNYSDLKIGLPTQSVLSEGEAYHEPVRLLTFVEAPLEIALKAVKRSIAKDFILNEWIRPVVIDREQKKVFSYEGGEFIIIKEL